MPKILPLKLPGRANAAKHTKVINRRTRTFPIVKTVTQKMPKLLMWKLPHQAKKKSQKKQMKSPLYTAKLSKSKKVSFSRRPVDIQEEKVAEMFESMLFYCTIGFSSCHSTTHFDVFNFIASEFSILELFELFMNEEVIDWIVANTIKYVNIVCNDTNLTLKYVSLSVFCIQLGTTHAHKFLIIGHRIQR